MEIFDNHATIQTRFFATEAASVSNLSSFVPQPSDHPPTRVDRLIVHQFDPAVPSPGGIDTCIRGLLHYAPEGQNIAVVGVDTGRGRAERRLGEWEVYESTVSGRRFHFLPVARLDPADQARRVPHSARLAAGLVWHRRRLPTPELLQVHRMDMALTLRRVLHRPFAYFIHTQESGLTGTTSDSFWRFAGQIHARLERDVIRDADHVVVFNPTFANVVKQINERTHSSATWYDPALITTFADRPKSWDYRVVWVGRLEVPKDPVLAIDAFAELVQAAPQDEPWSLHVLGSGTLQRDVEAAVLRQPDAVRSRIRLLGRVSPSDVAVEMASARLFLMTSHPGYEGFPRVLVESLASGLSAVVTNGSDTGALVKEDVNGFITSRSPSQIAQAMSAARGLGSPASTETVASLSAPVLVENIFRLADGVQHEQRA